MKFFPVVLFFLFPAIAEAQLNVNIEWAQQTSLKASDVIYYNAGNKLEWKNFQCQPPTDNSRVAAITMSGFGYSANLKSQGSKGQLNIQVYCFFNKNRSWVKPGKTTSYILNHEQHHFDISYIAATIFMDKIQAAILTKNDYNSLLPRIYDECIEIMNKMQDDYDGQTKNGQESAIQDKWNKFINDKISLISM